jgi:DNA repair exonuclease SbcCD ATPase subunit
VTRIFGRAHVAADHVDPVVIGTLPDDDADEDDEGPLTDEALTDPAAATQLRERATEARQRAERTRADAEVTLSAARELARRLVTDAETKARALTSEAKTAEVEAGEAEQRARTIDHAQVLRQQIAAAEQHTADLATEHGALTERIAALTGRLAELGQQREDHTVALATAREAGAVEQVTQLWTTMRAVDEVTATLTGQLNTARDRANAIGEPGWAGEYDQAAEVAAELRRQLSDLLDVLDPERPGRLAVALTEEYARVLVAAGTPEDQALAAAALLVAVQAHPEAAEALFGTAEPPTVPRQAVQRLIRADGTVAAEFTHRT